MCRSDTRNEMSSYFNENCRHRPMYSSHIGIPANVDLIFVTSVEPLLLKYQVTNHTSKLKLTAPHCCEKKWDRNTLTVLTSFGFAVSRWIWFSSAMYTTTRGLVHYIRTIAKACQRRTQVELILMTPATIPRQFMPLLELEGSAWTNSLRLW